MEKMIFNIQKSKDLIKEILDEDLEMEELLKKYPDQTIIKVDKEPKLERVLDFQRVYEQNYPPEKEKYDQLFIMLLDEIDELNRAYNQEDKQEIKKEMADVFNCVIMLANHLGVDLEKEASNKTDRNLRKYNPTKIEKLREENIALREARELLRQAWKEREQ
jgi:NTP pyrophosphatase (non-canonical NTP hydrolase)